MIRKTIGDHQITGTTRLRERLKQSGAESGI